MTLKHYVDLPFIPGTSFVLAGLGSMCSYQGDRFVGLLRRRTFRSAFDRKITLEQCCEGERFAVHQIHAGCGEGSPCSSHG